MALLNAMKRTANVIAITGVECLTLERESFLLMIADLCELKERDYGNELNELFMKTLVEKQSFFDTNTIQGI